MRKTLDLNCAPIDQYPATKVLTESDLTTSQLVLPRPSVEEFIVPNMPRNLRERLAEDGRADIWLVDDENRLEHLSTMVHHDCIYSITGWNHVHESRPLREGDEVRFGWMDEKLHFIVTFEGTDDEEPYLADNDNSDEDSGDNTEKYQQDGETGPEKGTDKNMAEPPAKRKKTDTCESSIEKAVDINP